MRKGRSHRKANRVSRPSLLGSNAHVDAGSPSSPQVVIGVSPSTPPAPAAEPVSESGTEVAQAAAATAEVLPEPSTPEKNAAEKEADEPPPASEKRIATVRPARFGEDTLIDARPPEMDPHEDDDKEAKEEEEKKPLLAAGFDPNTPVSKSTLIMGSSRDENDVPKLALSDKTSEPPPAVKEEAPLASFADEPVEKSTKPGLGESKKEDLSKAMIGRALTKEEKISIEPTPTPSGMALPIEDEISVPPIVGEPTLERFFSEGDLSRHNEDVIEEVVPEKLKRKTAPHVVQRRARFARYVTWAVGISAVVCLAAVARTALSPKAQVAPAVAAVTKDPALDVMNKAAPLPTWKTDEAKPAAVAMAEPPKVEAKEALPAATAEPPKAEEAKPSETAAAAPAPVEGDAKAEKKACKQNLERGKIKDAIEAGEKSVAIDPTDGEAWLLLGASYQEMGKLAEARRCYTACIKEGKTGPRNECAKMLR